VRSLLLLVSLVVAGLAAVAAAGSDVRPIPWTRERPRADPEPSLASPCRAESLQAGLSIQGALGSLLGGVSITNVGQARCSLLGRPEARFVGGTASDTLWRAVPGREPSPDPSGVYDTASSLRSLAPGRAAFVALRWSNWCSPGAGVTGSGLPPEALVLALPDGSGELPIRLDRAPRCDFPDAASVLAVSPFVRVPRYLPESSQLPLRASIVGVPKMESKLVPPVLQVARGGTLRYAVALTNVSARPFRFRSCPTYSQRVVGRGATEVYVLNCRPMGVLQPRGHAVFAMMIRVPQNARLGVTGLSWELAPTTYLPPFIGTRVLVTR
jgi:hypothetical protein